MIILISGPINAGKTTIGRALSASLPQTAHVEVDTLREFVPFLPLEEAIPINLENAATIARNFVRRGFGVVLTYPLGQADYDYLLDAFTDLSVPIHTFILGPTLATALADRGARLLSEHERRRIREQYNDGRHRGPFGIRLDTTAQTPAETVATILHHIRAPQGTDAP